MHCILTYKEGNCWSHNNNKEHAGYSRYIKATLRYTLNTINSKNLSKARVILLITVQEQKKRHFS